MLFNSYSFIFLFLPTVLAGFFLLKPSYRMGFLILASVVFYGQWHLGYLALLLASIMVNFSIAKQMMKYQQKHILLFTGIVLGLLPLVYFKYSVFIHLSSHSLVLPLAISFYTFQQIAFLVDVYQKKIEPGTFDEYLFFVLFFPQLIAGPIVHYGEVISQVQEGAFKKIKVAYIQVGVVLFSIGLFKKVVLADLFFPLANKAFDHIDTIGSSDAWVGMFAYSFGIYFDFSGYTDMALGLALLFGIKLPINFNSPYKAVNVVDFWRRWHMTLSHFLRDYVYIPLGGNRSGRYMEGFNLIVTMSLGGIWHGAGWNFLLWGLAYGVLLAMLHLKQRYVPLLRLAKPVAIAVTFVTVSLLWILFRAESLPDALQYYALLFSGDMIILPLERVWLMLLSFVIVWLLPNSMEVTGYMKKIEVRKQYTIIAALLLFIALKMMADAPAQTFVYFNF